MITYYNITHHYAGFGTYVATPDLDTKYDDINDILCCCTGELYELGVDDLPEGMDDIRGRIEHEPARVFAERYECGISYSYFGLSED